MPPFESVTATVGRNGFPTFAVSGWEGRGEDLFGFSFLLTGCRTSNDDGCLFLLEPRASDLKHTENKTCSACLLDSLYTDRGHVYVTAQRSALETHR